MMNHQELIETASKDEWTLECDKKMLDMMQNIASKIENRAANTKSKMNAMIFNLDETKVKMSNLTRINDVKNAVFCENLITDDHLESINEVPKKTGAVELLSPQIAIENGLKLMENCFEKHRVNLDPSKNRNETAIVYRPIDKFYSPLPYLIGSDKWKEKWHLGLIEEDKVSQTGSNYAESVESSVALTAESNLVPGSNLMASTDSLAKSSSSIGDQMAINKPSGLFDDAYDDEVKEATSTPPAISSFFRPQPTERKIVNLFDDEPPELDDSSYNRKPVNLFEDDYESVASLPIEENIDKPTFTQPQPVDLFNENEFDSFIKRMENRNLQQSSETEKDKEEKVTVASGVQRDMKLIADEIKKVQLKKKSDDDIADDRSKKVDKINKDLSINQKQKSEVFMTKDQAVKQSMKPQPELVKNEPKDMIKSQQVVVQQKIDTATSSSPQPKEKPRQKITNLFDDDEDDYFSEIMKQKSAQPKPAETVKPPSELIVTKIIPEKKKITNLFDDDDDDDAFDDIFNKNSLKVSTPSVSENKKEIAEKERINVVEKLFDDVPQTANLVPKISESLKPSNLFDKLPATVRDTSDLKTNLKDTEPIEKAQSDEFAKMSDSLTKRQRPSLESQTNDDATNELPTKTESKKIKTSLFDDSDEDDNDFILNKSQNILSIVNRDQNVQENTEIKIKNEPMSESSKIEIKNERSSHVEIENSNIESKYEETPYDNDQIVNFEIVNDEKSSLEIKRAEITTHEKMINANIEENVKTKPFLTSSIDSFNRTIPFLDDEPPDDEDAWEADDTAYDEPEPKPIINQSKSSFKMPLFDDEIPPDDENISESNVPPVPNFDDFEDDDEINLDEREDLPIIPEDKPDKVIQSPHKLDVVSDPFGESIKKSLEKSNFDNQWEDFKNKIQVKTEIDEKFEAIEKSPENSIKTQESEVLIHRKEAPLSPKSKETQPTSSLISSKRKIYDEIASKDSFDELDRSVNLRNSSNIISKLDLIKTSLETPNVRHNMPKKIPGKLNSSLKINVSALMPGAISPMMRKEKIIEYNEESNKPQDSNISPKNNENTNLLNNEATKSRAKIQVRRRPSTRKGRRSIYEKSLNEQLDEEEEEEKQNKSADNDLVDNLAPESETKVNDLSSSNFSTIDNEKMNNKRENDEKFGNIKVNIDEKTLVQSVVTNKIPVFYDDEYETKKMLEEQKAKENEKKSLASSLFDDIDEDISDVKIPVKVEVKKEIQIEPKSKISKSLFDDVESDEDIFRPKESKETQRSKELEKTKVSKTLFDDDEDDDNLFGKSKEVEQKSAKLSDNSDKQHGSTVLAKHKNENSQIRQSLFGDSDEEDDDDLFRSKPKNVPNKSSTGVKSTASFTAKNASRAVTNDPLKDLLEN